MGQESGSDGVPPLAPERGLEVLVARLHERCGRVAPLDGPSMAEARSRQDQLTKPGGSLGRLERLAVQIAGATGNPRPRMDRATVIVMAGDHGVAVEGVSAYPSVVTGQMVANFAAGGAAINVLARTVGARVLVVDVGVAAPIAPELPIVHARVASGTANMTLGPALTRGEALQAIVTGFDVVDRELERGLDVVCLGEMGIGNSTAAAAIVAVLTGRAAAVVTGRGTGIDDATLRCKISVIERAIAVNQPTPGDALGVLAAVGGLEIAGLVGVVIAAAAARVPIVVDGFIATSAAMLAVELCPSVRGYLVAAHRSVEPGHGAALQHLEIEPLLALDLRLGEGTGAVLALPILRAAVAVLSDMATFADAGVATRPEESAAVDAGATEAHP